jgi:hypothetical protein
MDAQRTLHKQYLAVFDGAAGKAVLSDLMARGMVLQSTFNSDPMKAAYNEGKRSIALYIHNMLDTQRADRKLAEQGDSKNG